MIEIIPRKNPPENSENKEETENTENKENKENTANTANSQKIEITYISNSLGTTIFSGFWMKSRPGPLIMPDDFLVKLWTILDYVRP